MKIFNLLQEILHIANYHVENILHLRNVKKICNVMWRNYVFVAFSDGFCDLCCFVAKSVLTRFTHFCVEKVGAIKLCLWRKNDKYQV